MIERFSNQLFTQTPEQTKSLKDSKGDVVVVVVVVVYIIGVG